MQSIEKLKLYYPLTLGNIFQIAYLNKLFCRSALPGSDGEMGTWYELIPCRSLSKEEMTCLLSSIKTGRWPVFPNTDRDLAVPTRVCGPGFSYSLMLHLIHKVSDSEVTILML